MKQILFIFCTIGFVSVFAQKDSLQSKNKKETRLRISEVSVYTGREYYDKIVDDFDNFTKMAKNQSGIPNIENYEKSTSFGNIYSYGINIALSPYKEEDDVYNHYRKWQIGLNFKNGNRRMYSFENEDRIPISSLVDTTGLLNETYQKDTAIQTRYTFREGIQEMTINTAYLLYTNPRNRVSFNTGLGLNVGFSLNSSIVEVSDIDTTLVISSEDVGDFYLEEDLTSNSEINYYDAEGSMYVRMYIPIGVNLRLSNSIDVLNQLSLYLHGIVGYEYQNIYGVSGYWRNYWGLELGIRHFF